MSDNKEEKKLRKEDDDSDCEIEGMDMEGDDEEMEVDDVAESNECDDVSPDGNDRDDEATKKLAQAEHDEMEAAKEEQMELMEAERKRVAANFDASSSSKEGQLQYLLAQSEVFAYFLAGT